MSVCASRENPRTSRFTVRVRRTSTPAFDSRAFAHKTCTWDVARGTLEITNASKMLETAAAGRQGFVHLACSRELAGLEGLVVLRFSLVYLVHLSQGEIRMSQAVETIFSNYAAETPGVIANLRRLLYTGALAGTGKLVILPVDQGFEHGPARSFAPNPEGYDPAYHPNLAVEAGCNAYAAPPGFI